MSSVSTVVKSLLPIDPYLDQIVDSVRRARAAVVTAAPGAGKTTRVPPALMADGPVILLQPRRVAARAIAARIAHEQGWTLGREVGWQVRFERRMSEATQLLVVTEGILTARLQSDPLLSQFRTIVLDEFHERSIHADLAIALARQAWRARDDLRIVVMSATLDARPVSAFLGDCPAVEVPGRTHPVDISYAPGQAVASAVADVVRIIDGQVLCFLPGIREIHRAVGEIRRALPAVEVLPLHGSLDADSQDLALQPSSQRRVIVATNIAETSLTVPGVTAVIDSGLHKVSRFDTDRGIDSLETERITSDAADQRAGRAGREAPGVVRRLWDIRDRLRPHREPEISRIELSSTVLDVIAWGGDPRTLEWFEPPQEQTLEAALTLLVRLGLIDTSVQLTPLGEHVRHVPLHPRLGRMLAEAGGARDVIRACALLSERHLVAPRTANTSSDLLSAIDRWDDLPGHVKRAADHIQSTIQSAIRNPQSAPRQARGALSSSKGAMVSESAFLRAVLSGYPDRVAQRRAAGSSDVLLSSGTGARIGRESGVLDGEFLVALDVTNGIIRIASRIDREWLAPTASEIVHRFDRESGRVKAVRIERYDALTLSEHAVPPDTEIAARILADAWTSRGPTDADQLLLHRLKFAGHHIDLADAIRSVAYGAKRLDEIELSRALTPDLLRRLDRDAPEMLVVPSGRRHRLEYAEDGTVGVSVKLQELFGLAETPRIGPRRDPVVLSLLAPNGRPVQVTRDLRSFWDRTYPEVRKELRGRYPKHPWPEDPWRALPSAKLKPKS